MIEDRTDESRLNVGILEKILGRENMKIKNKKLLEVKCLDNIYK